MKVLYIGGTGEISFACIEEAVRVGHRVSVFNRGQREAQLPDGVEHLVGDIDDAASYERLASAEFDVVCQFLAFDEAAVQRDVDLFNSRCGQYIFISTASVYEKPCRSHIVTEDTPADNSFWLYSRKKASCENLLRTVHAAGSFPVTIVRPSHTYRTRFPSTVIDGNHLAYRIMRHQPVIVHGDGESLWTLTHATDFSRAFVQLCGRPEALGETYHITDSQAYTWNVIISSVAEYLGEQPDIRHVSSDALIRYNADWTGPLLGDKANSMVFDNQRINGIAEGWRCEVALPEGVERVGKYVHARLSAGYAPDARVDALVDRIIREHEALGA